MNEAKIFLSQNPTPSRGRWILALAVIVMITTAAYFYFSNDLDKPVFSTLSIPPPSIVQDPLPTSPPLVPELHPPLFKLPNPEPAIDPRKAIAAIENSLLLHLPFTSSLDDHSSYHRIMESSGAVSVHDGAAHFPGDSFLTWPHIPLANRPFACAVWIRPEGKVVGYGLLEQVEGGPGKHLHLLMRDPDKPYFGFYLNDLRSPQSVTSEMGWTHLTFIFTGTHQQIWINGLLVIERNSDPFRGEKGEMRIGKAPGWNNVPTQCFKGAMRDLRIYDFALSPQQIRILAGLNADVPQNPEKPAETF